MPFKSQSPFSSRQKFKSHLCQRLKAARQTAGFTSAKEFAQKKGLKISTYTLHEAGTRTMSLEVVEEYANLLNINFYWLLTGLGSKDKNRTTHIPIIKWEEVIPFRQKSPLLFSNWTSSDNEISTDSFGLIINDESMQPLYPEGTIVIVDCQQQPINKDLALFYLKEENKIFFKQLVIVNDKLYGKSIHPDYKPIILPANVEIIGKIVQAKLVLK